MKNFFTPVPARRISTNSRLELRVATDAAAAVRVEAVTADGRRIHCGQFPLEGGLKLNKVYPALVGITGKMQLYISFLDAQEGVLETCGNADTHNTTVSPSSGIISRLMSAS